MPEVKIEMRLYTGEIYMYVYLLYTPDAIARFLGSFLIKNKVKRIKKRKTRNIAQESIHFICINRGLYFDGTFLSNMMTFLKFFEICVLLSYEIHGLCYSPDTCIDKTLSLGDKK